MPKVVVTTPDMNFAEPNAPKSAQNSTPADAG